MLVGINKQQVTLATMLMLLGFATGCDLSDNTLSLQNAAVGKVQITTATALPAAQGALARGVKSYCNGSAGNEGRGKIQGEKILNTAFHMVPSGQLPDEHKVIDVYCHVADGDSVRVELRTVATNRLLSTSPNHQGPGDYVIPVIVTQAALGMTDQIEQITGLKASVRVTSGAPDVMIGDPASAGFMPNEPIYPVGYKYKVSTTEFLCLDVVLQNYLPNQQSLFNADRTDTSIVKGAMGTSVLADSAAMITAYWYPLSPLNNYCSTSPLRTTDANWTIDLQKPDGTAKDVSGQPIYDGIGDYRPLSLDSNNVITANKLNGVTVSSPVAMDIRSIMGAQNNCGAVACNDWADLLLASASPTGSSVVVRNADTFNMPGKPANNWYYYDYIEIEKDLDPFNWSTAQDIYGARLATNFNGTSDVVIATREKLDTTGSPIPGVCQYGLRFMVKNGVGGFKDVAAKNLWDASNLHFPQPANCIPGWSTPTVPLYGKVAMVDLDGDGDDDLLFGGTGVGNKYLFTNLGDNPPSPTEFPDGYFDFRAQTAATESLPGFHAWLPSGVTSFNVIHIAPSQQANNGGADTIIVGMTETGVDNRAWMHYAAANAWIPVLNSNLTSAASDALFLDMSNDGSVDFLGVRGSSGSIVAANEMSRGNNQANPIFFGWAPESTQIASLLNGAFDAVGLSINMSVVGGQYGTVGGAKCNPWVDAPLDPTGALNNFYYCANHGTMPALTLGAYFTSKLGGGVVTPWSGGQKVNNIFVTNE